MNPVFSLPRRWCTWLQKDNPTGTTDHFPELKNRFETSVPGLYCIGDLTGIPLIKLAADSGTDFIDELTEDSGFSTTAEGVSGHDYDLVIIGGGPAGIAASLRASERGIRHVVLEATRIFNTIHNFPSGKPVYITPADTPFRSTLRFNDGTKETLLGDLNKCLDGKNLPIRENVTVSQIEWNGDLFSVHTPTEVFRAKRVAVAIGKTGNARRLGVQGEDLPHVFTRLIDPGEFKKTECLVIGGGDSAVETAIALAAAGNRVTFSYRKPSLSRPGEQNASMFNRMVANGSIVPLFASTVESIEAEQVTINHQGEQKVIPASAVFIMIGSEIPRSFFRRSHIRIEGDRQLTDWLKIAALLLFSAVLYFGKKAPVLRIGNLTEFLNLPQQLLTMPWHRTAEGIIAWGSFIAAVPVGLLLTVHFVQQRRNYFTTSWNTFKYGYFGILFLGIMWLYVEYKLMAHRPLLTDMGGWYTLLYSLTIVIFGIRRMYHHPTGYIRRQTLVLMAVQVIPLCILPMFILPALGKSGLLGSWIMTNVFPGHSYWRAFGFVLAWPLFIYTLATGQPTLFWLITGVIQSFVIIPLIVYKWGKGAYCGWICSCGALAETLGDEYRTLAPHGPTAKKWENAGQAVLLFAIIATVTVLVSGIKGTEFSRQTMAIYTVLVDIFLAGVLGVGVYFSLSGRVWCRFFCPLAALMHIYARFSVYRIFADKKRCISCGICTKVCHMGIDVMGYANKGIPMNDVECVRCSACVVNCPMRVLQFGSLQHTDPDNKSWKTGELPPSDTGWKSGLPEESGITSPATH